ncbi:translocation/assembly module TamB domain-containing protein, partial [Psychroserpens sp.]|uniref:translocation/assembly module TamB domain-containing protein n=1 Tax=Psychroserpens sp. TaxID=2020870 RepID=UPI003C7150A0
QINAAGTLASVSLPNVNIFWGEATRISANGILKNITNPETVEFDIPQFSAETKRSDAILFVNETDLGVSLPAKVVLAGSLNGNPSNISATATLTTTQGIATIDGSFKNTDTIAYDVALSIEEYKINELLNNPQLGALSLSVTSQGSGTTINTLDATLDATVSKFQLNEYAIKDLNLKGNIKNGNGNVVSKYKDDNLNINLDAFVVLDSIAPEATVEINVIGANLQALGLMKRNVKTGMNIYADFKGTPEAYDATAIVDDGVIVYDNKTYLLGNLDALAHVRKDTTSVSIANKMLNINLKSNSDPQTFSKALERHVLSYFYRDDKISDTITDPVNLTLEGLIAQSPLLNDVFLVNVKDLDTINISVDFKEKARVLKANITAPHINYGGNELDSLSFSMDTDKENFNFNLGFKNIKAGPLDIPKTIITGNQANSELSLNFLGYHDGERLMNVNTKITGNRERLIFSVNPDSLILNKHKWAIPTTNDIILTDNNLEFTDFKITKDNQSIEVTDKLSNISKTHVAITYDNFKISEVFNYLNPDSKLATGQLNGDFILEDPFGKTGLLADLSISNFTVLKTDLGTLSLNGNSLSDTEYAFNAGLKGGDINLDLVGDYTTTTTAANLNLDLNINEFKMKALNTLSLGEVKDADGSFNGKFKVTGTTSDPQYDGTLNFIDAQFNIAKLNTKFTMPNETLNANNEGLSMSNFTILDENNNKMVLSGEIGTESFINPTFNLDLKANNFQVLNATQEDNADFYGKASFNADAKLTGDLQIPKLNADVTVGADTDVTYVMPATYASIEERDGVVVFVNRENPNAILTQTEEQTATIKGFDISTRIKIGKDAAVTVVIDEETGDNFRASGEGELLFNMLPNGRISLTGGYEIEDGHYELNLYNLVNRKFLIAKGSRVTWSGDPFDAKLDVRAIYNLETSASSLMAPQISGADPSVKNKFRQVLPFNVYLNINGELLSPEISFGLDMPEEVQGSIGGQVYGRVQQVNAQEGELNKQVFSLLVLNRFYPDSGSDGSSGGFATVARDNLNDAVSEQLNSFSDKLLGSSGIELDFGLNSYTDYQGESATERTQLDVAAQKKLFNDRLTVRVGSEVDIQGSSANGESTPLVGNVSLEYMVSQDGRYRLKGFRKSEFENVIDGQTIVSGIALIFTQEFNHFDELWDAILRSQSEKKEKLEADQKAAEAKIKAKEEATDKSIEQKKN